jgi:hypothetical protein
MISGRHQLVDVIAQAFSDEDRARRALFYAMGGLDLALAYGLIWFLLPKAPAVIRLGAAAACAWGIVLEAEVFACRIAAGIDKPVAAPMWRGICDGLTGLPLSTITLAIPALIAYWLATKGRAKNG